MTGIVNEFAGKYQNAVETSQSLNKEGCRVPLKDILCSYVVIDLDKEGSPLSSQETRCDFLFISERPDGHCIFSPLEFKKGALDASRVVEQLQSGANLLEDHPTCSENAKLAPVAVSGQNPKAQLSKLAKSSYQIRFNGRLVKISHMKCGNSLVDILEKYL